MKRNILFIFGLLFLASCVQIKQLTNLLNCDFRVSSVDNIRMADIDVQKIKTFTDLKFTDGAKLLAAVASGTLPLNLTVNVEAKNPNTQMAALNKMDWILLIDDIEMANGSTTKRVEVPANGGTGTFPIAVTTDLAKVLSGQSAKNVVNFGLNLAGYGSRPTRIAVKAKPTILVGGAAIMYPGYITIKSEYGGN
jgi:hypothetical protein